MEVFMYVLRSSQCSFLYFVVRIRRRRKKFTFAISSADEFLVESLLYNFLILRTQMINSSLNLKKQFHSDMYSYL